MNGPSLPRKCEAIRLDLGAYLDGELSLSEWQAVEAHLSGCEGCREELDSLRVLTGSLHQLSRPEPPESIRYRLLAEVSAEWPAARVETMRIENRGGRVTFRKQTRIFGASSRILAPVNPDLPDPAKQWRTQVTQYGGSVQVTVQTL